MSPAEEHAKRHARDIEQEQRAIRMFPIMMKELHKLLALCKNGGG